MLPITTISVFLTALLASVSAQSNTLPVTGSLGNATVVENNPPGKIYTATLPTNEFFNPEDPRGNVKGSVSATANPNGIGVSFQVSFENLPTSGGPFLYHIHAAPVPSDGNCTGTLGHLDPFVRGETPACEATLPQTCQVGDLSGKYGKITTDPFTASYTDDFASTNSLNEAYLGNLSVTMHFGNTTRITCANFTLVGNSVGGNGTANATATKSGGPIQYTGLGDAKRNMVSTLPLLAVTALAFLL